MKLITLAWMIFCSIAAAPAFANAAMPSFHQAYLRAVNSPLATELSPDAMSDKTPDLPIIKDFSFARQLPIVFPEHLVATATSDTSIQTILLQTSPKQQLQCRQRAGVLDQCVPVIAAKSAAVTANPVRIAEEDRVLIADLVFPDPRLAACVNSTVQTYGWTYADEVTSMYCYHIFQLAPISDLTGLQHFSQLGNLYLGGSGASTSHLAATAELSTLSKLHTLTLEGFYLPDLQFLTSLPLLRSLGLNALKVDAGWQILADLDAIEILTHAANAQSDQPDIVALLNQMTGVTSFLLNTDDDLAALNVNPNITSAYLVTASGLNFVSKLPNLTSLTILNPLNTNLDISALVDNEKLLELNLTGVALNTDPTAVLTSLNNLTSLTLSNTESISNLAFVGQLAQLQRLDLTNSVTMANLATLVLPPSLTNLKLLKYQHSGYSTLTSIAGLITQPKNLTSLDLTGQEALPCSQIGEITSKVTTVLAPAQCGITKTKLADVNIPDLNLYNCIANKNAVYLEDITNLSCNYVKSLTGIEHLTGLTSFALSGDSASKVVTNLAPLEQLTSLVALTLYGQNLTDSQIAIDYPASLTVLSLPNNLLTTAAASTLQPLLPQLQQLNLSNNNFASFSWITAAPILRHLFVGTNPTSDISFLNNLPDLNVLSVMWLNLSDLSGVELPANLTYLDISDNALPSLKSVTDKLKKPELMNYFFAGGMSFSDFQWLQTMPNLLQLGLNRNKIVTDYSAIGTLSKLEYLTVDDAALPAKFPDFTVPPRLTRFYMNHLNPLIPTVQDISELVKAAAQFQHANLTGQFAIDCAQVAQLLAHTNKNAFVLPTSCGQTFTPINSSTIPDDNLRQCLLNRGYTILQNVTSISCESNIRNWTGVSQMSKVTSISIRGNESTAQMIQGLSEINALPILRTLRLQHQGLTDAGLAVIENDSVIRLDVVGNPITHASLAPMASHFPGLLYLDLSSTKIADLQDIGLLNAQTLTLLNNPLITSYNPLNALSSSTTRVELEVQLASYLTGLKLPATVTEAVLSGAAFTRVDQTLALFHQPANLTGLVFDETGLTNLDGLAAAAALQYLYMYLPNSAAITDLSPLNHLHNLIGLGLSNAGLKSLTQIATILPQLTELDISYSAVTDLTLLKGHSKINFVDISQTQVTDVTALHNLPAVSYINLEGNTHLPCAAIELLKTKVPAEAIVYSPFLCTDSTTGVFKSTENLQFLAVAFVDAANASLGSLKIVNGNIVFTPSTSATGWLTFAITATTANGESGTIMIRIWIAPVTKPKKRKGLPWWVIAPKAA